jgi:hypothetical protein
VRSAHNVNLAASKYFHMAKTGVLWLRSRYILPSHQDDFVSPLSRGFVFGKLINFPQLLRTHEKEHLPGRVIILDYFRPWTLR